jgi:hypothetical protein
VAGGLPKFSLLRWSSLFDGLMLQMDVWPKEPYLFGVKGEIRADTKVSLRILLAYEFTAEEGLVGLGRGGLSFS